MIGQRAVTFVGGASNVASSCAREVGAGVFVLAIEAPGPGAEADGAEDEAGALDVTPAIDPCWLLPGTWLPRPKSHAHVADPCALAGAIGPRAPSNGSVRDPVMRVLVVASSTRGNDHC